MNRETDNNFIIEESKSVFGLESLTEERKGISILPHLLILGAILFGLFATIIIPKTFSALESTTEVAVPLAVASDPMVLPASVSDFDQVSLRAKTAYVWDIAKQKSLFEKESDLPVPIASITKLMTALVSYELIPDETPLTINTTAARQQSGGTLKSGEVFVAKELANFALISSYNSAAYTLAASVGQLLGPADPTAQFVTAMNIKADELNLKSMRFYNPTGLDQSATEAGAYASAKDVSRLVEYILINYPEILDPTVKLNTRIYNARGEYHEADNTNNIITDIPNLLGSKTGYTDLAGGNLTVVFDAGFNHPVVITVLGSTYEERFADVKRLIQATKKSLATK